MRASDRLYGPVRLCAGEDGIAAVGQRYSRRLGAEIFGKPQPPYQHDRAPQGGHIAGKPQSGNTAGTSPAMTSYHPNRSRRRKLSMANPVLVEVIRGPLVESRHRGAVAVCDAEGNATLAVGDVTAPIFPRSAVKALQALPLIERGAAERFGLSDEELALACASHSGEAAHIAGVERMLAKAALAPSDLHCGAHWPIAQAAAAAVARSGSPTALHNNCSGKHAGFLCVARAMGVDAANYWQPEHPVQRVVRGVLEDFTGISLGEACCAIDGCSVPTWAVPLHNLAHGFAKFGTGRGISAERAQAAARLRHACAKEPWFVAGTGRFCTEIMQLLGERVFVKTGAEGVYCAALPQQGLGIAVKCEDGASRAAQAIIAAVIARFLPPGASERAALQRFVAPVLRNWNGFEVGQIRVSEALR
jgi:L-asparaginase II